MRTRLFVVIFFLQVFSPVFAEWVSDERPIMGTLIKVELWHEDVNQGRMLIAMVMTEMHRIDGLMSTYKADSELASINKLAGKKPLKISTESFNLINRSLQISRLTNGAFDITYASIGDSYNYLAKKRPTHKQIGAKLGAVGFRHIRLDKRGRTINLMNPDARIDLGGIAKGHAVDQSVDLLSGKGITSAIVSAGGDSRIIGDRRGRPWMVGIRHPRTPDANAAVLPLVNKAISTSGDYERYFIENGQRYHHIIDPGSGRPVSSTRSVTIVGPDATTTDALSTSVFVMGAKAGLALIETLAEFEAIVIDNNGRLHFTSGLRNYLPPKNSSSMHETKYGEH